MDPAGTIRTAAIAALGLSLGSCAALRSTDAQTDLPSVVRGSTIIVHPQWPGDDPFPTAERFCAQTGRYPEPRTITAFSASYQCVAKSDPSVSARGVDAPRAP